MSAQWASSITRISGAFTGQHLEQSPDRPRHLLADADRGCQAQGGREDVRHHICVVGDVEQPPEPVARRFAGRLDDCLTQRPEGDAVAVGEASPRQHRRLAREPVAELLGQPRLADAGFPEHRQEIRLGTQPGPVKNGAGVTQLAVAPDHRTLNRHRDRTPRHQSEQFPGRSVEGGLDERGVEGKASRRVAHEDLAVHRGLSEPNGSVQRIAPDVTRRLGDHLTCRGADAHGQAGQLGRRERFQVRPELVRGAKGAYHVVLPDQRDTEHPRQLATQRGHECAAVPDHDLLNAVPRRRD